MSDNKCCFYFQDEPEKRCDKPCNWEIRDADGNEFENDTYSCDEHLSGLLFTHNTVDFIGAPNNQPCPI
jgi:hypothetical protein